MLKEKGDLIAALVEQLAVAHESTTGSTSQHDEELAQLTSKHTYLNVLPESCMHFWPNTLIFLLRRGEGSGPSRFSTAP